MNWHDMMNKRQEFTNIHICVHTNLGEEGERKIYFIVFIDIFHSFFLDFLRCSSVKKQERNHHE